jgi:predicted metal-dependent enzyme (double-stranded beta helix superfamily)
MVARLRPIDSPPRTISSCAGTPLPALVATVAAITRTYEGDEVAICIRVAEALAGAARDPGWIGPALRVPSATTYRREKLYQAPDGSFSIGCFVWGPGQRTPIHDHRAWGVVAVAAGALESVAFFPTGSGRLVVGAAEILGTGTSSWLHPEGGDIHRIGAAGGETAISIHVYGCRIDAVCRRRYLPDGTVLTQ